jgi:hypothetical protein
MPRPDRALRRMAMDLATLHPEDADAVLGELDPGQRNRIEMLLADLSEFGFGDGPQKDVPPAIDPSRLSPWLVARAQSGAGRMTERTRAKLRECAARLYPLLPANPKPRGSLFRLFGSSGERAAR